ncbi:MAG: hypothetical protein WCK32_00800 [Chlorobiaceae bacterium]
MAKKFMLFWILALAGCGSLTITKPKTFDQQYAYALTANAALREAATTALVSDIISVDDAKYVLATTDQIRTLLKDARLLSKITGSLGEGKLAQALDLIDKLKVMLQKQGVTIQ